jgi:GT2 family glycosyltransferase
MVRAQSFKKIGGYNEKLVVAEDNDLFLRLSKIGKVKKIWNLKVYHTGRRAHQIGWLKLLFEWLTNYFSVLIFKKSISKKWKEIR